MDTTLAQSAIDYALNCDWDNAISANLEILKNDPGNIDALNRLAKAYAETGKIDKAKNIAKEALKIDPLNSIALKSLSKWQTLKKGETTRAERISPESFLEIPGKTKLVSLIHPGDPGTVACLCAGDVVEMSVHPHRISITSFDKKYLGRLPDDLAARLRQLIESGFKYQAVIKSVDVRNIKIFIREIQEGLDGQGLVSFPGDKIEYISFTPPGLVNKEAPIRSISEN